MFTVLSTLFLGVSFTGTCILLLGSFLTP